MNDKWYLATYLYKDEPVNCIVRLIDDALYQAVIAIEWMPKWWQQEIEEENPVALMIEFHVQGDDKNLKVGHAVDVRTNIFANKELDEPPYLEIGGLNVLHFNPFDDAERSIYDLYD